MKLNRLRDLLTDLKKQKQEAMDSFDAKIEGLEVLAGDYDIRERISLPLGDAVLLNDTEKFFVVVRHLLGSQDHHVGFKTFEKEGTLFFSVRLNLIEQLLVDHYGVFESERFKVDTRGLLKKWKKQGVPLSYRRTSSINFIETQSNKYLPTYAIEMSKKTFEDMLVYYLQTDGNEVWRWKEQRKLH